MRENEPLENVNEKELVAKILEAINEGNEEDALLLLKRYRRRNLSPLVYARMLVLLDKLLAERLNTLAESFDMSNNNGRNDRPAGRNAAP